MTDCLREEAQRRASQRRESRQWDSKPPPNYYYAPNATISSGTIDGTDSQQGGMSPQRLFSPQPSPAKSTDSGLVTVSLNDDGSVRPNNSNGVRRNSLGTSRYTKSPGRFRILDEEDERQLLALSSLSLANTPTNEGGATPRPSLSPAAVPVSAAGAMSRSCSPTPLENTTLKAAKLAEKDYKFNGNRAKRADGEFIPPRWIPDEESENCVVCNVEFDDVNDWCSIALASANMSIRRHHCRYCGHLVCDACSPARLLLPMEYGLNEPQRVCNACAYILGPLQHQLSATIAKYMQTNTIDVATEHCNVRRYMNSPYSSSLNAEIRKAAYSLHNMLNMQYVKDKAIPLRLIAQAKGLAFLTIAKGGFIFAPSIGTGLVISRLSPLQGGGWSAPCAISTIGVSWGAVIGVELTDYVIVLNTEEAVAAFMSNTGQVTIGAGLEVAVGPIGRSGSADVHISDTAIAPAYSYSQSRGFYAGLSLDGSVIMTRNEVNFQFYATQVSPADLLTGRVPPPRAGEVLYNALSEVLQSLPDVQHAVKSTSSTDESITPLPTSSRPAMTAPASMYHGYPVPANTNMVANTNQLFQQNSSLLGGMVTDNNRRQLAPSPHPHPHPNSVYNIGNAAYNPPGYLRSDTTSGTPSSISGKDGSISSRASTSGTPAGNVLTQNVTPKHTPPPLPPSMTRQHQSLTTPSMEIIY